ncbi:MAG: VWA domain-containing protein [Acidobacteriota bacterium]
MAESTAEARAPEKSRGDDPLDAQTHRTERRWLLVTMLALATLAMHAVLTSATTSAPPTPSGGGDGLDFRLPGAPVAATPAGPTPAAGPSGVTVSAQLDRRAVLTGTDGELYVEVEITGPELQAGLRQPTDLVVVLDHSGSMEGDKIRQAKRATVDLVDRLSPDDTFTLVTFSSYAQLALARAPASDDNKRLWRRAIEGLSSGGGTDMVGGLDVALDVLRGRDDAERPCRVLLLSDGRPNTEDGLDGQARGASRLGAALSSLGVGADFNETLMARLSDLGAGNYYFLDRPETIAAVFAGELAAGRGTVAKDLRITLEPSPGTSLIDAAGYPIETTADGAVIRPGHLYAGQVRRLWLALSVDAAEAFPARSLGELAVSWRTEEGTHRRVLDGLEVAVVSDRDRYYAGIDADAWGRAVVSEEYGRLQSEVAAFVRSGQRAEAEARIREYGREKRLENTVLRNEAVEKNLEQLTAMHHELSEAFSGADQATKQKVLSKRQHMASQAMRRADKGGER